MKVLVILTNDNLFLRVVELWVSIGHVPVRVEFKALNVEPESYWGKLSNPDRREFNEETVLPA